MGKQAKNIRHCNDIDFLFVTLISTTRSQIVTNSLIHVFAVCNHREVLHHFRQGILDLDRVVIDSFELFSAKSSQKVIQIRHFLFNAVQGLH